MHRAFSPLNSWNREAIINADHYCTTMTPAGCHLDESPCLLTEKVILLHYNAHPQAAQQNS
jgi:hypothetical protein